VLMQEHQVSSGTAVMGDSEIIVNSNSLLDEISEYIDLNSFNRIINKLTDYAELLNEGKIAGLVNYNYTLNSAQTNKIIELLLNIQAISRIFIMAIKGSRDLESEYMSNIISDVVNPENISAYLSLRNLMENRLGSQTQLYNMSMTKVNTTMTMPINELRGHVKTYQDLTESKVMVSDKAQHGMIAASLHDAYIILLNKPEYWSDKTYMKFFFNDDDASRHDRLLITRENRLSLYHIKTNIDDVKERLAQIANAKLTQEREYLQEKREQQREREEAIAAERSAADTRSKSFTDRMLTTPFGKQYGSKIDAILNEIFSPKNETRAKNIPEERIRDTAMPLFELYLNSAKMEEYRSESAEIVEYLLFQDYNIKTMAEKLLHNSRKETFARFYTESNRLHVEAFLTGIFAVYFHDRFEPIFRIIKSLDMKKFACAYIVKRIYLSKGENISNFGFFLIRTISKLGGIKIQ
jgi:hypothetical protein